MASRYITSHTALRGIAALLVVIYHLQFGLDSRIITGKLLDFFSKGYLCVDLFFILSGFVISYSTKSIGNINYFTKIRSKNFFISRLARIYPLHFFCLVSFVTIEIAFSVLEFLTEVNFSREGTFNRSSLIVLAEQFFLLNAWGLSGKTGWNIPSWSISAEMFAYLLFPGISLLLSRVKYFFILFMVLFLVCFYGWVILSNGTVDIIQGLAIVRCISGFFLGVLIYLFKDALDRLNSVTLGIMQTSGLILISAAFVMDYNDVTAIAGFFLIVSATWPDRGWLAKALSLRTLHWLGEISYSIYLVHVVVLGPYMAFMPTILTAAGLSLHSAIAVSMASVIVTILTISNYTYHYVEIPAQRFIKKKYTAKKEKPLIKPV